MSESIKSAGEKKFEVQREPLFKAAEGARGSVFVSTNKESGEVTEGVEISRMFVGSYDPAIRGRVTRYLNFRLSYAELAELIKSVTSSASLKAKVSSALAE